MDMKRFKEIDGLDVLKHFSKEESVYNEQGNQFYIDDCKVWMTSSELSGVISLTIANVLEGKWYVKKPFDVRAEMLARPNEWVGAFKVGNVWHRVGFSTEFMTAFETRKPDKQPDGNLHASAYPNELDDCIPIEDVPEEELA